ncbi:hypothetical protein PQX77_014586 [Marasmius sp. AFHP31]|nr:hypothetical protein PQX77_014586 [Marasmius sp. AFHP31]
MEIVLSCLSMIILCTWTSIRPNVPSVPRSAHEALVYWDKAKIFFIAFIAPELIILWSTRQFFTARKMAKEYQKYGWTITHAFFAIMGGFALYDSEGNFLFHLWDGRFCGHFKDEEDWDGFSKQRRKLEELLPYGHDQSYSSLLEYCVANKMITMTEKEIESLGHADILAKTITFLQTLHFITTCIARGANGLAITELEFFTLGFAALNLVNYLLWWHKPLGVRFPVHVLDRPRSIPPDQLSVSQTQDEGLNSSLLGTSPPVVSRAPGVVSTFLDRMRDEYGVDGWDTHPLCFQMPVLLIVSIMDIILSLFSALQADRANPPQPERGNMFSGSTTDEHPLIYLLTFSVAVILGIFHCIPIMLNYRDFPGHTEDHQLWTVFALLITVLPLGATVLIGIGRYLEEVQWAILSWIIGALGLLAATLYPIARIVLMRLAVKQLTDLPPSALQEVEWTTLIPHFGV